MLAVSTTRATTAGLARPTQRRAIQHQNVYQRAWTPAPASRRRQLAAASAGGGSDPLPTSQEESEGLLPEEDPEIPGTYRDAMTTNTQLGKAVKGACDELDTLGELERQTLTEAEDLLKKLGFKGSLFAAPQQGQQQGADGQPPGQQQQSSGNES